MELTGAALIDHLQFLIAGVEQQTACGLLQFLAGLSPRLWGQIRASALLPDMIAACSNRPLDLAMLVYLCTESPATVSAVTSACIKSCLSVLAGKTDPVESSSQPTSAATGSQIRRRRKRLRDESGSTNSQPIIRLPESCQLAHNRPSLLMGHSLSRASCDPNFAQVLYRLPEFLPLMSELIAADFQASLRDHYLAFRLHKCISVLENISSLQGSLEVGKSDLMQCLLPWLDQVIALEFQTWINDDGEHSLLQSVCSALRALINLTNGDANTCAALRSAKGITTAIRIIQLCEKAVAKSSAACDLTTIAIALLTNCAEVDQPAQKLLCAESVLTDLFQNVSQFWEVAVDTMHPESEQMVHCRTVAGYVSLLISVLYLGCSDQRQALANSCSILMVADILDQFAALTKLCHPEQTQMIEEINRIYRRLVSSACFTKQEMTAKSASNQIQDGVSDLIAR